MADLGVAVGAREEHLSALLALDGICPLAVTGAVDEREQLVLGVGDEDVVPDRGVLGVAGVENALAFPADEAEVQAVRGEIHL